MAHIRVIHDPVGETLTVYWAEPRAEQVCEETGEGIVLIKDARTQEVIGFERLYYRPAYCRRIDRKRLSYGVGQGEPGYGAASTVAALYPG